MYLSSNRLDDPEMEIWFTLSSIDVQYMTWEKTGMSEAKIFFFGQEIGPIYKIMTIIDQLLYADIL